MRIGPKYKIARRLGAPVFEKTQTQKFVLSQARKEKSGRSFSRPKSNFGLQLLEKQKARFTYCLSEKQFSKYAKGAVTKRGINPVEKLFGELELRADNVAYRSGFAPTRLASRQLISHGHMTINGKRITIPSYKLSNGDVLAIRGGSASKPLFASLDERLKSLSQPSWIQVDKEGRSAKVVGVPKYEPADSLFDLNVILEFYSR